MVTTQPDGDQIPVEMPYLPFLDAASTEFRWRLGLRPLDVADWIEWGADSDEILDAKTRLNERHPDTVFAVLDDVETASAEIATAIAEHVGSALRDDLHPLDAAARLVPEDLVLMVERPVPEHRRSGGNATELVFGGGSVCFPNRWDLASKLGCTMNEVHEPVARLNAQLDVAIDRFFARLRPERSYWRLGWGILDTVDWFTPTDGTAAPRPIGVAPGEMHLRVERETLRRFPQTNAILFTIRTHVAPLDAAVVDPRHRQRLAETLDALPSDVRDYKDLTHHVDALIDHLSATPESAGSLHTASRTNTSHEHRTEHGTKLI